jgi:membrane protease YdiL (CAAX protease family)
VEGIWVNGENAWRCFFAFCCLVWSSLWLHKLLKVPMQSAAGLALDKLDSSLIIVITILLFTKLSGNTFGSIFLQKGKLKRGLTIGGIAFLISALGSVFMANTFGAQNLTLARIVPWIPWILIFVMGNAFNEELLFRGMFLRKLEPLLGKVLSNLVLILPFVLHHTGVTYTNDALMFLAYLIPLAFAWGAITQKTDSLLGSVLFHAGTDLPVILAIFSKLS